MQSIPSDLESEAAVLGCILLDPRSIFEVSQRLQPADFYLLKHRLVYEAALKLSHEHQPVDFVTLTSEIDKAGKLKDVGGAAFISALIASVPSSLNVAAYARSIAENAIRRRLIHSASEIAKAAYDGTRSIEDVLDQSQTSVFNARGGLGDDRLMSSAQAANAVLDELNRAQETGEDVTFSTGYTDLDKIMLFGRQEFSIVAARPGIGKTSLLMNIAQRVALARKIALFFSCEMGAKALVHRILASEGKISLHELRSGKLRDVSWPVVTDGLAAVGELPLWIDDTPNNYISSIRSQAMRFASTHKVDLICVDYLQLVRVAQKTERRDLEIAIVTRELKALSRELDCHVIAASQLSRAAEGQEPNLSHLRESGSQEQDADNVVFISVPRGVTGPAKAKIIVAKHRNGPTGSVDMVWVPNRVSFLPAQRRDAQAPF